MVYARTRRHWVTRVDAFRRSGFTVTEGWPLDTERPGRGCSLNSAVSIEHFLPARKRHESAGSANYEEKVHPELREIVRERVKSTS
jgi:putative DNA methylase